MEKRTEAQVAADEALTKAIENCALAYKMSGEKHRMIGEYIVVYADQYMDEEGEIRHSYGTLLRNGSGPATMIVGLLETASFDIKSGRNNDE